MNREMNTISNEDKGYALRSQFGWSCLGNGNLETPRREWPGKFEAKIADGGMELKGVLG